VSSAAKRQGEARLDAQPALIREGIAQHAGLRVKQVARERRLAPAQAIGEGLARIGLVAFDEA
jgi:hypothetical protein